VERAIQDLNWLITISRSDSVDERDGIWTVAASQTLWLDGYTICEQFSKRENRVEVRPRSHAANVPAYRIASITSLLIVPM
jgi:hypothetical protein